MEEESETFISSNKSYSRNSINKNEGTCSKVITPYVSHTSSSVDWINKSLTKLDINSNTTKIEPDVITDDKCLAGYILSVISTMGLVLIQPLLPNLLYLDTPLFLYNRNALIEDSTNYIYLGKIDDICGSVNEPMYSVYSTLEIINLLRIGDQVHFLPNNPDTQLMCVEHTSNNGFNIIKKKYNE